MYQAFAPAEALRLAERIELVRTPKHGSWLNMTECELSVLSRQCLGRRQPDRPSIAAESHAWITARNADQTGVD